MLLKHETWSKVLESGFENLEKDFLCTLKTCMSSKFAESYQNYGPERIFDSPFIIYITRYLLDVNSFLRTQQSNIFWVILDELWCYFKDL